MYMLAFMLIHFLCVAAMILWDKNRGDLHVGRVFIVALVPLFGPLCEISTQCLPRGIHGDGEKLHLNEPVLEDDIYRSIHIRPEKDAEGILPLEESLLINDPVKRRNLILNILNLNPADYVAGLRKAGVNDDTEVVHYAVTALVELRKDYNERLFRMEKEWEENPGPETLEKYRCLDEEYLRSGLAEKEEKLERIRHYDGILEQVLSEKTRAGDKVMTLVGRAGCSMALGDYDQAIRFLDRLLIMEPDNEDYYYMKLQCLIARKDRSGIDSLISLIKTNQVFLSDGARQAVTFWDRRKNVVSGS